jgi:predicted Zn-dependent protease
VDLVCRWKEKRETSESEGGLTEQESYKEDGKNYIEKATITIWMTDLQGSGVAIDKVYSVSLHEIGHALGLAHSPNPRDIMFFSENGANDMTRRDEATVFQLYQDYAPASEK